jgi:hypothetical protein
VALATLRAHRRLLIDVAAVLSLIAGVIGALAVTFPSGWATGPIQHWLSLLLGWMAFLTPAWLIGLALVRLSASARGDSGPPTVRVLGAVLASLALPAIVHLLPLGDPDPTARAFEQHGGGGAFGLFLSEGLVDALGLPASAVLLAGGFGLGLLLLFDLTLTQVGLWIGV